MALAENELHRLAFSLFGSSIRAAIAQAIAAHWSEDPSGGHYQNFTGPYTLVGCAALVVNGEITFVQDLR